MGKIHYDYWYDVIRPGKIIRPVEYLKKECYYFSEEWQREIEILAIGLADKRFDWDGNKVHNGFINSEELEFIIIYKYRYTMLDDGEIENYIEEFRNWRSDWYKWFRLGEESNGIL